MTTAAATVTHIAWWKEPTKDQWYAYVAAWAGWTLDAFDFTAFLLIIAPIAKEFDVPVPEVAAVLTITLWMRLLGATASGWLADRIGRKTPLMISIAWYSVCNFLAGLAPSFFLLFLFRALLGIGMGAEWPAGAALAMETWPVRSRGFMGAVMQGSWGIGFLMSSAIYGLFATHLQLDLKLSPGLVALPIALANTCFFLSSLFWGWLAERIGRRWAIIIPAALGVPTAFLYLMTDNYTLIVIGFALQGMFACGGMHVQYPAYLSERFPTEVRATAVAFCFHQGAIWGGLISPLLLLYATTYQITLSGPILVTTVVGLAVFLVAVLLI